jgi:hypothetical protein
LIDANLKRNPRPRGRFFEEQPNALADKRAFAGINTRFQSNGPFQQQLYFIFRKIK